MPRTRKSTREEIIRVRFTPDELAIARRKAKGEGVPLSTYLRRLALTVESDAEARRQREARVKRAIAALDSMPRDEAEAFARNVEQASKP